MGEKIRIINIELGMPTVPQGQQLLLAALRKAKAEQVTVVKIIHGYGSTGVGGKLKDAVRKSLANRKREGKLRSFVAGERWSIFDQDARDILEQCSDLKRDSDLENGNAGITIALL
ncbi:MAG TPA: Smr/MutS family protein [Negativicutes bacterium]|jgi:phage gp16-like protein